jgi:ATP-dependent DNA ligase
MTLPNKLPAGFVVPAQPVEREAPPSGADWVHEIKHDGYRMLVRRDGEHVRLFSRKAIDWTTRLPAIATGAAVLKAQSFTIDGEAVVIGPDGLTDFEALLAMRMMKFDCTLLAAAKPIAAKESSHRAQITIAMAAVR